MTEPLIEASRVKFAGMSSDNLEDPPKLDEARTYTVEATCTAESDPGLFDEADDDWGEDDTSHDTPVESLPLRPVADPFGGKG